MFNTSLRYNFNSRQPIIPNQQTPLRKPGFGGHFQDAPPFLFGKKDPDVWKNLRSIGKFEIIANIKDFCKIQDFRENPGIS